MTQVLKNNFVDKASDNFLIDPDTEVYYEWKIVRVDQSSKYKRTMTQWHSSNTEFTEVCKKYGLKPHWKHWEVQLDMQGKPTGKGKYVELPA